MSIRERTIRGIRWAGISQVATQVISFGISVIVARLLMPRDYGLVGMAAIFTGLIATVGGLGMGPAIVQRQDIHDGHLSSAFWVGIGAGVVLFFFSVLMSPLVAVFLREEMVRPIMVISSLGFVIAPVGTIHNAVLNREMNFKGLAIVEIGATIGAGVTSLLLALNGYGVWSLVCGGLTAALLTAIFSWKVVPWRPSWSVSLKSLGELWVFSVNMTGFSLLNYLRSNVDYLLVGKLLGSSALGIYTLAYNLVTSPQTRLVPAITRVLFPAFSKIQEDNERLRSAYLKIVSYISLATVPLLVGLMAIAPEFVRTIYGEKWEGTIVPVQILCLAGILYAVGTTVGSLMFSKGRSDMALKVSVLAVSLITICVYIGSNWGINGVAAGVMVYALASFLIIQHMANSLIDLKMKSFLCALKPAVGSSLVMLVVILGYRYGFRQLGIKSDIGFVLSSVALGAVVYIGMLKMASPKVWVELMDLLKGLLRPASKTKVISITKQGG